MIGIVVNDKEKIIQYADDILLTLVGSSESVYAASETTEISSVFQVLR